MTTRSWIRRLFADPPRTPHRTPPRNRPRLEVLEDRTVPAPIKVTTFADVVAADGLTSLREVVAQAAAAAGDDAIQVPAGEYDLSLGQLEIDDDGGAVTIKGVGGVATIDAQGKGRVMNISGVSTVRLVNLTLTGGSASGSSIGDVDGFGGGIFNRGMLTLTDSTVSGNTAGDDGGGLFNLVGTLLLLDSIVSVNTAGDQGDDISPRPRSALPSVGPAWRHGPAGK